MVGLAVLSQPGSGAELFGWDKLTYRVEWRMVPAGTVVVEPGPAEGHIYLQSGGLLNALFKVENRYTVHYDGEYCATTSTFDAVEGRRHRETTVTYDRAQRRASYVQRDVVNNTILRSGQTDIPECAHDMLAGLLLLRGGHLEPGQSAQVTLSDGRRTGQVKVTAQEREVISTPAGMVKTIRFEADIFNGVIYMRKGRAFIWVTDDDDRIPVEIKLRLSFPVGTVTLDLEKQEHP
jgi:Protein of unknown function (DUF3108)